MRSRTQLLVTGMLVSGVCNTILNKLQDMQCVENCDDPDPSKRQNLEQPVWQTLNMFVGEAMCFVCIYVLQLWESYRGNSEPTREPPAVDEPNPTVVTSYGTVKVEDEYEPNTQELTGWRTFLLWLPTMCDICGTTLMNVGLIYTSASVYQMLRGAVVLFTGAFSVVFLRHRLLPYHWLSLFIIVLGVSIVGLSSVLFPPERQSESAEDVSDMALASLGVLLVLFAQVFTATQFVIEERIMVKYRVAPLRAVGLEGVFGVITVGIGMVILHFTIGRSHPGGYFDITAGWNQFIGNRIVLMAGVAICFSIAFFNFFGLAVTRTLSATARSTIDTCRIVFIWMVSLFLGWEMFSWMQVIGFVVLVLGTSMFNNLIDPPSFLKVHEEQQPLVVPVDEELS